MACAAGTQLPGTRQTCRRICPAGFQRDDRRSGGKTAAFTPAGDVAAAVRGLRFASSLFTEMREILFARVTQRAVRQIPRPLRHLHALSLRFHLERQTGGVSRDIERGSRSISTLITSIRSTPSCPPWWKSHW